MSLLYEEKIAKRFAATATATATKKLKESLTKKDFILFKGERNEQKI